MRRKRLASPPQKPGEVNVHEGSAPPLGSGLWQLAARQARQLTGQPHAPAHGQMLDGGDEAERTQADPAQHLGRAEVVGEQAVQALGDASHDAGIGAAQAVVAHQDLGIPEVPPRIGVPPGAAPEEVARPEDVVVAEEEDVVPEAPEAAATVRAGPEALDATISALRGGVANLTVERALAEIDEWQLRLGEPGDPELLPVAENLWRLSSLLTADEVDAGEVGELLKDLGGQVQHLADSEKAPATISDRLKTLGGLLASEGDSVSG